jgi:hypothetical protein
MTIPQIGDVREFYTQLDLGFYAGQEVIVYNEFFNNYEDPEYVEGDSNYFIGKVDFYYPNTGLLTVVTDYTLGSGTFSYWQVTVSSLPGLGATGPQSGTPTLNLTFSSVESFTVTHNSGVYPLIQILDGGGNYFLPTSIVHTSTSSFDLSFATYSSGIVIVGGGAGPQGPVGPSVGPTASFQELTVTGPTNIQQVVETLTTATSSPGLSPSTFNLNFDDGSIFYIEPEGDDFVANYLNVPTTDNRIISTTIIITQTASAYIPNTVIINGDTIPISWSSGSLPTGNANQTDIVGFSFMRIGATWSKVFGQLSTFTTL